MYVCKYTFFVLFFNELSLLDFSLLGVLERFLSLRLKSSFLKRSFDLESNYGLGIDRMKY